MFDTRSISTELKDSSILYKLTDEESIELKQCLLTIYKDFAKICEKYSLNYMLGGGSALGAVRHKGFIPWDDDLDVLMPREDYNKFIKVFAEEMSEEYFLYAPNSEFDISNTFAKLVKKDTKMVDLYNVKTPYYKGVWMDIFPIENVPENKIVRKIKGYSSDFMAYTVVSRYIFTFRNPLIKDYFSSNKKGKINYNIRLLIGFLTGFMNYKKWYNMYDKFVQYKKTSNLCTIPTGRKHYRGEILSKDIYFPTQKGTFEGLSVNLPNDIDAYLRNLYGDYMKLPPYEKRERHLFIEFKVDLKSSDCKGGKKKA